MISIVQSAGKKIMWVALKSLTTFNMLSGRLLIAFTQWLVSDLVLKKQEISNFNKRFYFEFFEAFNFEISFLVSF